MVHARFDYNRIQDPALEDATLLTPGSTAIAADEPVFLLRAQDSIAPEAVREYALMAKYRGRPDIAEACFRQADEMEKWAQRNGNKLPDAPKEVLKA